MGFLLKPKFLESQAQALALYKHNYSLLIDTTLSRSLTLSRCNASQILCESPNSKPQKALIFYHSKTLILLEGEKKLKNRHTDTAMASQTPNLECRMYEAKYPEVDMAVMIQVKNIADMGAYVSLLEYNNIEGMILFSELSRRRIRSVSSLIKVGRIEPVMVLRVDKEKGYIDLSKRRVSEEDIQACEERYNKSKLVHSIMRHVAETMSIDLEVQTAFTQNLD